MSKAARAFLVFLLSFTLVNLPAWQAVRAGDLFWEQTHQFFDANGDPLSGGKIETFDAGTTTNRTVYQDSAETTPHTNPIILDSAGRLPASVYIPTGAWKYQLKTSADVNVGSAVDDIPGALDTASLSTEFAKEDCPVVTKTSNYSMTSADRSKCFDLDATGGSFNFTLLSAITAGDGKSIRLRKSDTSSNVINIATTASQTINGSGTTLQLTATNQVFHLVSDGANWRTVSTTGVTPGSITTTSLAGDVTGRLMKVGDVGLFFTDTCPAGYQEADGSAISRTGDNAELFAEWGTRFGPGDGSATFNVLDLRGRFVRHKDGGAAIDPDRAARTDRGDGTTGDAVGTIQASAQLTHNHDASSIVISTNGAHTHTRAAGVNLIINGGVFQSVQGGATYGNVPVSAGLQSGTLTDSAGGHNHSASGNVGNAGSSTETRPTNINGIYCILASPAQAAGASAALNTILNGTGTPTSGTGNDGDFFIDTSGNQIFGPKTAGAWGAGTSIIGATGPAGAAGAAGTDPGVRWNFDTSTDTSIDPGAGDVRFDNATYASITQIALSDSAGETGSPDVSAWVATWDDSTNTGDKGHIVIKNTANPEEFLILAVTGITDQTAFTQVAVTHEDSSGTFAASDALSFQFVRAGDKGADGAGSGDVVGPASATDEAVVRFDTTTGKLVQDSDLTVDDSENMSGLVNLNQTGYTDLGEITAPAAPAANFARIYAFDDSAVTKLAFKDSAGTANVLEFEGHTHSTADITSGTFADARIAASNVTQHEASINHDNLSGFVANEHVDHSGVTITAGAGLTGGGDITLTRTLDVGAGTGITVNVNDVALDTASSRNVDHNAVSVIAGSGLTGGGTIAIDRTVNIGAGTGITVNADDVALDTTSTRNTDHSAVSIEAGAGLTGGGDITAVRTMNVGAGSGITVNANDVSLDTASSRNVDHNTVSINGGEGLTGGGTIAATRTLDMDVNGLTVEASVDGANDFIVVYDASAGAHRKVIPNNLPSSGGGEANTASNVGTAGVGVFKVKSGIDLQFKNVNAGSTKVTISDDTGNDEIDIDVDGGLILDGEVSANGIVVRTAAETYTNRTITGTANETSVSNGDGVSGNPTIGIADNPVLPGTEGFVPSSGTTAQRPGSPTTGEHRYNTTTNSGEFYNGSDWVRTDAARLSDIVDFKSSGTWTKPSNLAYIRVRLWGGGGGGGTGPANNGGSGGGYAEMVIQDSALGATETVTIGAGGASPSTAGGTTSFGGPTIFSATGGAANGGAAGTGVGGGGDIGLPGQVGQSGVSGTIQGPGGNAPYMTGAGMSANAINAARANSGGGGSTQASGGSGYMIIEEYTRD